MQLKRLTFPFFAALLALLAVPALTQASVSRPAPLAFPGASRSANANASAHPLAGGVFSTAPGVPARSLPESKSAEPSGSAGGVSVAPLSGKPSATEPYLACPPPKPGYMACDLVITPPAARLKSLGSAALPAAGGAYGSGLTPADLQSAYKLPSATAGAGQTVALVDAWGDPTAESDLAAYRSAYGLGPCSEANGCFRKVAQTGGSNYPPVYGPWASEQSLDVDMVSAICPNCHILLVEAETNEEVDLYEAESEAVKLGATEISNSWGRPGVEGDLQSDSVFDHPGIPITASSGDSGYDDHEDGASSPDYPASSPYVISVGGTVLTEANNARGWSESVWPNSGSGCSLYEPKPAFQTDSECSHRTTNDVAAEANDVSVYESGVSGGWSTAGGTSASAPIIAAVEALSESSERSLGPAAFYQSPGSLFNITTGSNGSCVSLYLCTAGGGYNGPTGNGTPDGALSSSAPPPPSPILTVHTKGTGSATIVSTPAGIECPGTCSASFPVGTQVTLAATPQAGSTFVGWSERCTGTGTCTISLSRGASTTAALAGDGTPPGWEEQLLTASAEREPVKPRSYLAGTFYNVSLSADGEVRAKTIYNPPLSECSDGRNKYGGGSDTGGVFIERDTPTGWVSEGQLIAPDVGSGVDSDWPNCSRFGAVTQLSADGQTLLVSQSPAGLETSYRCAAFVYHHETSGWALQGTLFPPGIGPEGSPTWEGCDSFGVGGAISADGTRVAILAGKHVDVFASGGTSDWSLEQAIVLPEGQECGEPGPKGIALSGDGSTLLTSEPICPVDNETRSGLTLVYSRSGSGWSLAQTIEAPEPKSEEDFGESVSISEDGSTATMGVHWRTYPRTAGPSSQKSGSWIYEREGSTWHVARHLTDPTPSEETIMDCPAIIEGGSRVICAASDTVGFDEEQGSIYIFERPPGGWASSEGLAPATRLFATEGAADDWLAEAGPEDLAATQDGSVIDATIGAPNLVNIYSNDRIGYQFTATAGAPPTISALSTTSGEIGSQVKITGTNLKSTSSVSFAGVAATYRVESATQITATVPEDAKTGPITLNTPDGSASSQFTVLFPISVSAIASGSAHAGEPIYDTAKLLNGSAPTGTITFQLYAASDTECKTPLATLTTTVTNGDGSYQSPPMTESTPGQYQWLASYSGDTHNPPIKTACNDPGEQVVVEAYPPAPVAISASSPEQTPTEATLTGQIDTEGQPASYSFEYGTSTSYGLSTPETPLSTDSENATAGPTVIHGLQPDTTYHYRLRATSPVGSSATSDQTFTTSPTLPSALTGLTPPLTTTVSTGTATIAPIRADVSLAEARVTTRGDMAEIKLTCSGTGTAMCSGELTLAAESMTKRGRGKTETIGTATFSIPAGKTATIELKLDAAGGALLNADHGRLKADLTVLKSSPVPSQSHTESVQLVRVKARGKTKR